MFFRKSMERYKIYTTINNEPAIFKRWGESEKSVKQDLISHIRKAYSTANISIIQIELDKTHTGKNEK